MRIASSTINLSSTHLAVERSPRVVIKLLVEAMTGKKSKLISMGEICDARASGQAAPAAPGGLPAGGVRDYHSSGRDLPRLADRRGTANRRRAQTPVGARDGSQWVHLPGGATRRS